MTVLPILKVGDPVLRLPAKPVTDFDAELRTLVKDLNETLVASRGAGLAAPQLGVGLRVFAINPDLPGNDIHLDHLALYPVFGAGVLERIPASPILRDERVGGVGDAARTRRAPG